jgi:alpha,alpha-trehalase
MSLETSEITITGNTYDALVFDLDGVVTQTAKVHASAWKQLFDEYLEKRAGGENAHFESFDIRADYGQYVDGKPRYEGVRSFLESRGIKIPFGYPDDPPEKETVCGLGNKKNRLFHEHLKRQGVEVYEPTIRLIRVARGQTIKTAVVSSSKNCAAILDRAHIRDLFDAKVDGVDSEQCKLKGKPSPDIFIEAARRLNVDPSKAVAFEDAEAGVESARRAGFGLVIGVDRVDHARALADRGAHRVVKRISQVVFDTGERLDPTVPSALNSLETIRQLVAGQSIAVFLDYDGTLTPIVEDPEKALMDDGMRKALIELTKYCTVAVISGRDLRDVQKKVSIDDIVYAGSHGFDIAGPEEMPIQFQRGEEFLPLLDEVEESLSGRLKSISGALVERKKFSVAVHYRKVKTDLIKKVEEAVDEVIHDQHRLKKSSGKKVFEIQPRIDWHKGKALRWLREKTAPNGQEVVPFYIGDDTTDEDAFESLPERGIGIVVMGNPRPTAAQYALKTPAEVETFIRKLKEIVKGEAEA